MIFNVALDGVIFAEIMVFSNEEKAVFKNDYLEKGWNAYKISEEHPTKSWNRVSVCRLSEKISRRYFYGWKSWFKQTTNNYHQKNENPIENLIATYQQERLKKHRYKPYFFRGMINKRGLKQLKQLKTKTMSSGTQERRKKNWSLWRIGSEKVARQKMCIARAKGFYFGCSFKLSKQSCLWI